jgi:DNA repair photolyase
MGLNVSKGNMYDFLTHTWNTVKGKCYHNCSYCYMKRWGNLNPIRFDEKELKINLGVNNHIFVGSSCDMFNKEIKHEWIIKTIEYCKKFDNYYFFQSKNPLKFLSYLTEIKSIRGTFCTTIETNRFYKNIMNNSCNPEVRAYFTSKMNKEINVYLTIEPIMDFDLKELIDLVKIIDPIQVNIGADSGGNNLPEPSYNKVIELIEALSEITNIHKKNNLRRLLNK